jgi:hypothetical protein
VHDGRSSWVDDGAVQRRPCASPAHRTEAQRTDDDHADKSGGTMNTRTIAVIALIIAVIVVLILVL